MNSNYTWYTWEDYNKWNSLNSINNYSIEKDNFSNNHSYSKNKVEFKEIKLW